MTDVNAFPVEPTKIDEEIEEVEIKEELAIQTVGLKKYFGRGYNLVKAVDGINLAVKEGEVHGYLGPNGAGKTTSMLMIAGTIRPTEGKGYIFGKPIGSPAANKQLGVAIANPKFWKTMSAYKYLVYMGQLHGLEKTLAKERSKEFLHLEMTQHGHRLPVAFSTGMKAKLAVAQALMHHPRLAILDESTAGLDPESRFKLVNTIKELADILGTSIFVSGHILTEIEKLVDRVTIIVKGKIGLQGITLREMRKEFSTGQFSLECSNPEQVMQDLFNMGVTSQIFMDHNQVIIFTSEFIDSVYAWLPEILRRNGAVLQRFGPIEVTLEEVFINVISKRYGSDFLYEDKILEEHQEEREGFFGRLSRRSK